MMSDSQTVLAALQTLTKIGLTAEHVYDLMSKPELSEADVDAQLQKVSDAIKHAREDN